jgi:hypothetical protein
VEQKTFAKKQKGWGQLLGKMEKEGPRFKNISGSPRTTYYTHFPVIASSRFFCSLCFFDFCGTVPNFIKFTSLIIKVNSSEVSSLVLGKQLAYQKCLKKQLIIIIYQEFFAFEQNPFHIRKKLVVM